MLKFLWRALFPRRAAHIPQEYLDRGKNAWARVNDLIDLGARHPGSDGHRQTQTLILEELKRLNCEVQTVSFMASTPLGDFELTNIIAKFSSANERPTVISGHYDTIRPERVQPLGRRARVMKMWLNLWGKSTAQNSHKIFPGANDGGSSTSLLLEMASIINETPELDNIWIVFFDGEEAFIEWSDIDQTYGSRHQAWLWEQDGTLAKLEALINLDMVGSSNFEAMYELNSSAELRDQIWQLAERLGYRSYFSQNHCRKIGDDHLPFVRAGLPALDIIDAEYGPGNGYWHTLEDSLDKLDPQIFAIVIQLLSEFLKSR